MFRNEQDLKDFVASMLEKEGFKILSKEFRVPEGYRVDLWVEKNNRKYGIEVKLDRRGISDDISKGSILHKLPEFDYIYIAAPNILISKELIDYAKRLRIGIIGVKENSIEWLQESHMLAPANLMGGYSLPD